MGFLSGVPSLGDGNTSYVELFPPMPHIDGKVLPTCSTSRWASGLASSSQNAVTRASRVAMRTASSSHGPHAATATRGRGDAHALQAKDAWGLTEAEDAWGVAGGGLSCPVWGGGWGGSFRRIATLAAPGFSVVLVEEGECAMLPTPCCPRHAAHCLSALPQRIAGGGGLE